MHLSVVSECISVVLKVLSAFAMDKLKIISYKKLSVLFLFSFSIIPVVFYFITQINRNIREHRISFFRCSYKPQFYTNSQLEKLQTYQHQIFIEFGIANHQARHSPSSQLNGKINLLETTSS